MNVPKLRFKEFNDTWKKIQLSSFVNINPQNDSLPEKFIYIDLESVNNGLLTSRKIINRSEAPSRAKRTIIKNDILYQTVRPYQMNNLFINSLDSDYPYIASTGYALLRTKENPYFVYSILHQKSFVNKVLDMCTGTSYPAINATDLGKISVGLPSIKEQEKISRTLELLDKKIELQTKKIEDLKLFKKGLLIKEFNNKKCNNKLTECFDFGKAGGTPKSTNKDYYNGHIPFLSIGDMTAQGKYIYYTDKSITDAGLNNSAAWLVPKNSIIISMYASYGLVSINKINLATSQAMFNMIINKNYVIEYIYYYLYYLYISNFYNSIVSTGTQSNLNAEQIKALDIYLPCYNEQKRIYMQFNVIDFKIDLERKKINELLYLKKGLMQNMFV